MQCWSEDEDSRETRSCRRLAVVFGFLAVGYLLTLFVWRLCA